MEQDYCVYFHKNALTGEVFYVGKGRKGRPFSKHGRSGKWKEYVDNNGGHFDVEIFKSDLTTHEASLLETEIINKTGYCLVNQIKNSVYKSGLLSMVDAFEYDVTSPTFLRWKMPKKQSNKNVGDVAGTLNTGYVSVYHNGLIVKGHRLIWVMHNKCEIPDGMVINHIDCNKRNNAIDNLECVSVRQNNQKSSTSLGISLRQDNKTGLNGISRLKSSSNPKSKAWHYLAHCKVDEKHCSKAFSIKKYGETLAKEMAVNWRDVMVQFNSNKTEAQSLLDKFNTKYGQFLDNQFAQGVFFSSDNEKHLFVANMTVNKKVMRKKFSVNKYGYDEAYRLACKWRKQMEELHYNKPE